MLLAMHVNVLYQGIIIIYLMEFYCVIQINDHTHIH